MKDEDITTALSLSLQQQLYTIAQSHDDADMAFRFFVYIDEFQELIKLIYKRDGDFTNRSTLSLYLEYVSEIDEDAGTLLHEQVGRLEIREYSERYEEMLMRNGI